MATNPFSILIRTDMHSRLSIITPTHNPQWLPELYEAITAQTHDNWQWVIVPNNGAVGNLPQAFHDNPKIKTVIPEDPTESRVGALKRLAAEACDGSIIVEVDHDDLITPDCLFEIVKAFYEDEHAGMVYSNTVNVDVRANTPIAWDVKYGWSYRPFKWRGFNLVEAVSAEPLPQNLSRIWFAPNHVRAWRKSDYWHAGGHTEEMKISDDHDLICRMYLTSKIIHIDKPLYIYRVHGENTWLKNMAEIQTTMWQNHDKYILPMMIKWSRDNDLAAIDLCGGIGKPSGLFSVDLHNADIIADLNGRWPFANGIVGLIRAHDAIEHLRDPLHTMNEAHRVLAHGGAMLISVPSTNGIGAWCDPTHVSFWNRRSFRYYTEEFMHKYIEPQCTAKFQAIKVVDQLKWDEQIPYVEAHLLALKNDSVRFYGEKLI